MMADDRGQLVISEAGGQPPAAGGVKLDELVFGVGQLPGFVEHLGGHMQLADVMDRGCRSDLPGLLLGKAEPAREHRRVPGNPAGMPDRVRVVRFQGACELAKKLRSALRAQLAGVLQQSARVFEQSF